MPEDQVKFRIAVVILVSVALLLAGASIRGCIVGDFTGLQQVSNAILPFISCIVAYYFMKSGGGGIK
jgi:hypothetical protein